MVTTNVKKQLMSQKPRHRHCKASNVLLECLVASEFVLKLKCLNSLNTSNFCHILQRILPWRLNYSNLKGLDDRNDKTISLHVLLCQRKIQGFKNRISQTNHHYWSSQLNGINLNFKHYKRLRLCILMSCFPGLMPMLRLQLRIPESVD